MIKVVKKPIFIASLVLLLGLQFTPIAFSQEPAPDFSLAGQQGSDITLSSYKGKLVYLDFWASWCPPCKKSFPWMNSMQEKYQAQGLEVIAINLDMDIKDAEKFLSTNTVNFTIAFDPTGATPSDYGVKGMPTSYLIDQDGNIVFQHIGFTSTDEALIEDKIKTLLQARTDI